MEGWVFLGFFGDFSLEMRALTSLCLGVGYYDTINEDRLFLWQTCRMLQV